MTIRDRLVHAYNAFVKDDRLGPGRIDSEPSYRDNRRARGYGRTISERTTVASIYNRIAIDAAALPVRHVRTDDQERFLEVIKGRLDDVLNVSANLDQNGRQLRQDAYQTICEEGDIALVAVETDIDPELSGAFTIGNARVGIITERKASRVKVKCWNEKKGEFEEIWQGKRYTPIVQNPMYAVMNEPNSTLQRLMQKLDLLDTADELIASGKLDIIIQLPYAIKSETRRAGAERRRKDMETQLKGSKYGVAYADATEKITQLNRPAENNLLAQVEWLTQKAYSELGLTKEIMDGTADEAAMVNYYNRTVEPLVAQFVDEVKRKWLTQTARTQGQSIMAFRDPFKFMPIAQVAEVSDAFSRNEILTSNEIRQGLGYKPSMDPKADELVNSANRKVGEDAGLPATEQEADPGAEADAMSAEFDNEIDNLMHDSESVTGFISGFLGHASYDPAKAHAYYERTKKLKGRKKGTNQDRKGQPPDPKNAPTGKARTTAIANKAASTLGPQRAAAIQKLADQAKEQLTKLTEEFRSWVDSHPKATDSERFAKRREMLDRKDVIVRKLKSDVAKISSAAPTKTKSPGGTEGRRH